MPTNQDSDDYIRAWAMNRAGRLWRNRQPCRVYVRHSAGDMVATVDFSDDDMPVTREFFDKDAPPSMIATDC